MGFASKGMRQKYLSKIKYSKMNWALFALVRMKKQEASASSPVYSSSSSSSSSNLEFSIEREAEEIVKFKDVATMIEAFQHCKLSCNFVP